MSGRFGPTVKRFAESLIERRIAHNAASDAHDADVRGPVIRERFATLIRPDVESHVEWLTDTAAAILAGQPLPPKAPGAVPREAPRRRWLPRR